MLLRARGFCSKIKLTAKLTVANNFLKCALTLV